MENYLKKYGNLMAIAVLLVVCFLVYFFNIGNYPLMDVDETRYVSMARDMFYPKNFMTLYLNGEYFFEKPPLYFWSECLSFWIFGGVNEFSARFPVALYGTLSTFLVYFTGKRLVSLRFGLISALILTTFVEFGMLARYAILDIVLTTMIGFSILFGFLTQFVTDKNKKYFWWLFYIFSGLAVMTKGLPGFIIPFGVMFCVTIFNKTFKQVFKPIYIIPGIILFSLIVLPWHILMLKLHDPLFFNEYIMKHHVNRFFSSSEIDRKQPFFFYVTTLLWGALPYSLSIIFVGIEKFIEKQKINFSDISDSRKFLWFNIIALSFTFLFFSASSTKLITYILPAYFFLAYITGYIWDEYIFENKHTRYINLTIYIMGGIFILAATIACFAKYFLPEQLYADILSAKCFCLALLFVISISSILFAVKKKPVGVFLIYVAFIALISGFESKEFYKIDYKFGQDDLIEFAEMGKNNNNDLYVINNPRKYSVLYYGEHATYLPMSNLPQGVFSEKSKTIIKTKDLKKLSTFYKFDIIKQGRKYSFLQMKKTLL